MPASPRSGRSQNGIRQRKANNDIDLGFNIGCRIDLRKASGDYDLIFTGGDWEVRPAWHADGSLPIGSIDLVSMAFPLVFEPETLSFAGNQLVIG